ncbi:unnamed protein product [Clonostachys chloroleuca]|uniref:Uncharacterized protein n=1 Tax=Clonostachys chloroleuca TaxID=1926264 RepID=A0AA35PXW0_9HYPO|nr:unnamed protein product [Clonostachys chloroleuca]
MTDKDICRDQYGSLGFARFCCPASQLLPTCTWRGHSSTGNCQPGCDTDEVELGSRRAGCRENHQSACCSASDVTKAYGECHWTDCLVEPKQACNGSFVVSSTLGCGGHQFCQNGYSRGLCGNDPSPAAFDTDCKWVPKAGHLKRGGSCPQDSIKLSLALGIHDVPGRNATCYGYSAYCCTETGPRFSKMDDLFTANSVNNFKTEINRYMRAVNATKRGECGG